MALRRNAYPVAPERSCGAKAVRPKVALSLLCGWQGQPPLPFMGGCYSVKRLFFCNSPDLPQKIKFCCLFPRTGDVQTAENMLYYFLEIWWYQDEDDTDKQDGTVRRRF